MESRNATKTSSTVFPVISDGNFGAADGVLALEVALQEVEEKN